ncbi:MULTISPECIES: diacylglycerol/lipid kinase family protein [Micromonospora]|uniref:diacylglycerol/lipid kinase family protein n=1 Tax=Micromonospora TaxID=1873 RepID=UPI001EE9A1F1|nr:MULTISPECIES: diacylglycerol kinase family protein [Micromonospora]MCG5448579.1 diacylglycerol kinase [Micromonospora hortensis]MCX5117937.1 diacylglycerol kinase family protein [Micromonospora sp. NBC_00362]WTI09869.1 diacylglycerol kinase family protein [Micromonospora sp. NBC_00821]
MDAGQDRRPSGGDGGLRSAVVVNPVKVDDLDELRRTVDDALTAAGWPAPQWYETTVDDPGRGQTEKAVKDGVDLVFACGGDGTVMSCVSGLVGTDVALAVLPQGTGNLLAANLGLSTDLAAGLQVAVERGRRLLDVGAVEDKYFTVMAGMGFDAQMLEATNETTKARIGWPAYVMGAARHLRDRPMRVQIRIDDRPPVRRRARSVLIANVGRLQGGVTLLTEAEPDDGWLDVAVLTPRNLRHWLALGWAVIRRSGQVPQLEIFRGRRVVVTSNRAQPRELDGDLISPGRQLRAEVRPQALWLCVPQPEDAPDLAVDAQGAGERGEQLIEEARSE